MMGRPNLFKDSHSICDRGDAEWNSSNPVCVICSNTVGLCILCSFWCACPEYGQHHAGSPGKWASMRVPLLRLMLGRTTLQT